MARLIDADAFSEQYGNYYAEEGPAKGFIGTVGDLIAKQPTIDAQPVRHGRWECGGFCSFCGLDNDEKTTDYCPHCGAKMDGGADNG